MATVVLTCRMMLAAVLSWSALSKLRPSGFRASVALFGQLGMARPAALLTAALCAAEAGVAVALVVPWAAVAAEPAAVALLAVLTAGAAHIVRSGRIVRCACFGSSTSPIGPLHLVRNAALLGCAVLVFIGTGCAGAVPAAHVVPAAGAGIVLAVLVIRLEDLWFLFGSETAH